MPEAAPTGVLTEQAASGESLVGGEEAWTTPATGNRHQALSSCEPTSRSGGQWHGGHGDSTQRRMQRGQGACTTAPSQGGLSPSQLSSNLESLPPHGCTNSLSSRTYAPCAISRSTCGSRSDDSDDDGGGRLRNRDGLCGEGTKATGRDDGMSATRGGGGGGEQPPAHARTSPTHAVLHSSVPLDQLLPPAPPEQGSLFHDYPYNMGCRSVSSARVHACDGCTDLGNNDEGRGVDNTRGGGRPAIATWCEYSQPLRWPLPCVANLNGHECGDDVVRGRSAGGIVAGLEGQPESPLMVSTPCGVLEDSGEDEDEDAYAGSCVRRRPSGRYHRRVGARSTTRRNHGQEGDACRGDKNGPDCLDRHQQQRHHQQEHKQQQQQDVPHRQEDKQDVGGVAEASSSNSNGSGMLQRIVDVPLWLFRSAPFSSPPPPAAVSTSHPPATIATQHLPGAREVCSGEQRGCVREPRGDAGNCNHSTPTPTCSGPLHSAGEAVFAGPSPPRPGPSLSTCVGSVPARACNHGQAPLPHTDSTSSSSSFGAWPYRLSDMLFGGRGNDMGFGGSLVTAADLRGYMPTASSSPSSVTGPTPALAAPASPALTPASPAMDPTPACHAPPESRHIASIALPLAPWELTHRLPTSSSSLCTLEGRCVVSREEYDHIIGICEMMRVAMLAKDERISELRGELRESQREAIRAEIRAEQADGALTATSNQHRAWATALETSQGEAAALRDRVGQLEARLQQASAERDHERGMKEGAERRAAELEREIKGVMLGMREREELLRPVWN
eukprot:jgi/Mesvir1/19564/Mv07035-RA.4